MSMTFSWYSFWAAYAVPRRAIGPLRFWRMARMPSFAKPTSARRASRSARSPEASPGTSRRCLPLRGDEGMRDSCCSPDGLLFLLMLHGIVGLLAD